MAIPADASHVKNAHLFINHQQRLPADSIDGEYCNDRAEQDDDSDDDVGQQRSRGAAGAKLLCENDGAVVKDRVNSRDLLQNGKHDADGQRPAQRPMKDIDVYFFSQCALYFSQTRLGFA